MSLTWLKTAWRNVIRNLDRGKLLNFSTTAIVTCGGVSLVGVTLAPHLFPDRLCRKRHEANMKGRLVPEDIQQIYRDCASKLGLKHPEKVRVFYSSKLSAVSAGSTLLPNGAVIGIPRSFLFRKESDVRNSGLTLQKKAIDWNSNVGKELQSVLITDSSHVSFTVAHEIGHLVNHDFILRTLFPVSWYFVSLTVIYRTLYTKSFNRIPRNVRVLLIPPVGIISLMLFNTFMKSVLHSQEFRADEVSAKSSLKNCKGGIDYMTKRLHANRLLRQITVPGKSGFTETGEDLDTRTHPPRSERIKRLKQILKNDYNHSDDCDIKINK